MAPCRDFSSVYFHVFVFVSFLVYFMYAFFMYKVNKTFSKNVQGCRDGSAKNYSN